MDRPDPPARVPVSAAWLASRARRARLRRRPAGSRPRAQKADACPRGARRATAPPPRLGRRRNRPSPSKRPAPRGRSLIRGKAASSDVRDTHPAFRITIATAASLAATAPALSTEAMAYAQEAAAANTAAPTGQRGRTPPPGPRPPDARLYRSAGDGRHVPRARAGTHKAASLSLRLVAIGQAPRLTVTAWTQGTLLSARAIKGIHRIHAHSAGEEGCRRR